VELVVGLLVYFFARELEEEGEVTTANYVQHLNTFAGAFLPVLAKKKPYTRVFMLGGDRSLRLLALMHEWMVGEGLTDYVVELAKEESLAKKDEVEP
jgi:hypothetical protein